MQLNDYIGETTSYDKKLMLERKDPTSWLKSVSAFANTQGGKLLFGVANDGSLAGLSDVQGDAEFISEMIKMQMERRGSGFGKILDAYIDASKRIGCRVEPAFLSDSSDFVVTLPNLHYAVSHFTGTLPAHGMVSDAKGDAKSSVKSGAKGSAKQGLGRPERNVRIIYRSIKGNPYISIGDLQRKTRLSNSGVRKIIAAMKAAGQLVRVGGPKGGHWEVIGQA